jgi:hypothetical protein
MCEQDFALVPKIAPLHHLMGAATLLNDGPAHWRRNVLTSIGLLPV